MVQIGNGIRSPIGRIVELIKGTRVPETESGQFLVVMGYVAEGEEGGPECDFGLFETLDQAKAVQLIMLKRAATPPLDPTNAETEN